MRSLTTIALTLVFFNCQHPVDWRDLPREDGDGAPGETPTDENVQDSAAPEGDLSDGPAEEVSPDGAPDDDEPPSRPVDTDDDPRQEETSGAASPVQPGGACDCDADCLGDAVHPGLCIHGICGSHASSDGCVSGSATECPLGQRCWSGTGMGICYSDFVAGECDGARDGDGSCVSDGASDCYASCGILCELPGTPEIDPDPDPDPPPDPDPEIEPDTEPDPEPESEPESTTGELSEAELDLFNALNDERAAFGLSPVAIDDRLMCAARNHALDVGSTGTCGHVGSDGSWPWDRAEACGFPQDPWTVNEIAAGPGFSDGADAVWGWQHSEGHHAAIVHRDAQFVGVGVHNTCFIALFDCCVAGF